MSERTPFFSVIVPVFNGAATLERCLMAIRGSVFEDYELIVVDDCSRDGSGEVGRKYADLVLRCERQSGPAFARNYGMTHATGDWLLFLDADCVATPTTLWQFSTLLCESPQIDAAFGSYDDAPAEANFVSQYKNLLHHYVHQSGRREAQSFWAGCGVVRRSLYERVGGFDAAQFPHPSIEDIELGYRLTAGGASICLASEIQVKHLKRWTLVSLIKTDVVCRALPWSRLLQERPGQHFDLNVDMRQRFGVAAVFTSVGLLALSWRLALVPLSLLVWLSRDHYRFFVKKRGRLFAALATLMHWLTLLYSGLAWIWVPGERLFKGLKIG